MVKGIFHTAVSVTNMEKTLHFYCDILGGKKLFTIEQPEGRPHIVSVLYPNGTFLEFFYPDPSRELGEKLGNIHFSLEVDDINELYDLLIRNEVPILSGPKVVRDKNWQVWCLDPNGYRVEFMQVVPDCPQRTPEFKYTTLI